MFNRSVKYREISFAELQPDVYHGPNCDDIRHRWYAETDGDMGGEDVGELMELSARTFPPGTKVTIEVPECPQCGETIDMHIPWHGIPAQEDETTRYPEYKCQCGFDWVEWTRNEFS